MGPSKDDKANPRGSHEDIDFVKFHKELFEMLGHGRDFWNPPSRDAILAMQSKVDVKIRALLDKKSKSNSLWGWKHPRSILTYELFLPYLVNPHFVLVFRNPLSTALSSMEHTRKLKRPLNLNLPQALRLVHFYQAEMLGFVEKHRMFRRTSCPMRMWFLIHRKRRQRWLASWGSGSRMKPWER